MSSNFPYNLNIPYETNDPSVDQPNMLTNTNSIASIIAVDHVGFDTNGSGWHDQVTFASNNVPPNPTIDTISPPVLFTNTVGSLPQLFFGSGAPANGYNQYVVNATNGSTFALGGIIIKWGVFTLPSSMSSVNVTYATAFNNACFSVQITPTTALSVTKNVYVSNITSTSQFTLNNGAQLANAGTYYYIAIGY